MNWIQEMNALTGPVAEMREAFNEQALKREWDMAIEDEGDAVSRKQAVLRKALKQWPMVKSIKGTPTHRLEMRRFVRDVLGLPDQKRGGMNCHAMTLLREGGREKNIAQEAARRKTGRIYRRAVVELVTKYKLGADPRACMDALAGIYEEQNRGKA